MLVLTDNVVKHFTDMLAENNATDNGVRIFAAGGGWGPSLAMDKAKEAPRGDMTLEKNGVKVFLEKEANRLLSEATLDYSKQRGIIISGMQRSSCCGWSNRGEIVVALSDNALKRFKYILAASRAPGHSVRIFIARGG